jgi:hypothetical protein
VSIKWYFLVASICLSLVIDDAGLRFMCRTAVCRSSLDKYLSPLPVLKLGALFCVVELWSFFRYSGYQTFIKDVISSLSFYPVGCLFTFLKIPLLSHAVFTAREWILPLFSPRCLCAHTQSNERGREGTSMCLDTQGDCPNLLFSKRPFFLRASPVEYKMPHGELIISHPQGLLFKVNIPAISSLLGRGLSPLSHMCSQSHMCPDAAFQGRDTVHSQSLHLSTSS